MKTLLALAISYLCATATFAQSATDPSQDPLILTNAFFKALLDEDSNAIGKTMSSDFSLTSFDGNQVDGDLMVQGVGGGFVVIETAAISDTRTRQYNSDAAVVTGKWKAKGNVQGQPFDNTVTFSVVCVKQRDSWKIVNVQFTPTPN
ncbi:nuclear transport factor 2 family protein [Spirosoma spitsbergense]|uniref:nuclear transport factor 2 family protein n=1 Tax=Spirosoma spitsbergense TaxID=431554 RepID=UPI0003806213|nr:nuclear transport factor 2 family protein [Spirosoma spitsbergense]